MDTATSDRATLPPRRWGARPVQALEAKPTLPTPGARSRYARARIVYCLAAGATVVALWIFQDEITSLPLRVVCGTAALFVAVAVATLVRLTPRGVWSLTSIYAVVFFLFHFGLVTVY